MRQDVDAFLEYLAGERGCSRNTLTAYRNDLTQLMTYLESEQAKGRIRSIPGLLKGYSLELKERGYSAATVARKVASVKSFFKFMVDSGRLKEDPTQSLVSPQVRKRPPIFLSPSEYQRLVGEPAKLSTPEAKRDVVMLELLYSTGLRVSELVSLNVSDIDLEQNCLYYVHGNSKRRVSLDSHMSQILRDFLRDDRLDLLYNEKEEALFLNRRGGRLTRQGFWQIIKNYACKANLSSKVTPRALRHSFAVHKLNNGTDIEQVRELLGHAHISSTRIYEQAQVSLR